LQAATVIPPAQLGRAGNNLDQEWRNLLAASAQIVCKFRRNTFACQWEIWRTK